MKIAIFGLSITSSWGNGHATTYRSLIGGLAELGHDVVFLERDMPWYRDNRDLPSPPYCTTRLYSDLEQLRSEYSNIVRRADLVIVGSFVPEGIAVGRWVQQIAQNATAFYDIDTPVTLTALQQGTCEYLNRDMIPRYDLYLSFTGGPALNVLASEFGASNPRALYCSVDPVLYQPDPTAEPRWDLGYLGTYSADRQPALEQLLLSPARRWPNGRFAVAGSQYPSDLHWPANVSRIKHLPPSKHADFYTAQRFTLNLTRADMRQLGHSPSVRLFEAAACGVPIISDNWPGLDSFFSIREDILIASSADEVLNCLTGIGPNDRRKIGMNARQRVLSSHTGMHRARELETYVAAITSQWTGSGR